ncbi:MAG TPA: hypothetical protein EYG40_01710 [Verrucomicrobia bacterium]|nr:hypothetical protein [Verrucomicrobiales bacterium]HIL53734.1 hypothetical protein [Verrucomicrobiota bacterium]
MTRSATICAAVFMLSLAASLGQGLFYWPQASSADGGTVNSSIASRAEDAIVEHYQAVPAPGYVFDSWSLYPRGEHGESLYVHTYDPRLFYTEEIKPITAHFVKAETIAEPVGKDLEICLKEGNQMELTVSSQSGVAYMIYGSKNMQDWAAMGVGEGNGEELVWTFPILREGNGFFRLVKTGDAVKPESAVFGELSFQGVPEFAGNSASAWVRLWEYDPRIADKGADLFAEQIIEEIPVGPGLKRFRFELGDKSKANPTRNYYITAAIYEKGRVGDVNVRIYFLDGFNKVDIPSEFSGSFKRLK